jgi:hypothetical protein
MEETREIRHDVEEKTLKRLAFAPILPRKEFSEQQAK